MNYTQKRNLNFLKMESAMFCVSIMKLLNDYNYRKSFKLKAALIQLLNENNVKHRKTLRN
jgi:hypothetical protein